MAELTLRFRYNPKTGKKELIIGYESELDALPHEHERDHRALAERLLGQPLGSDVDEVRVERVRKAETAPEPTADTPASERGKSGATG